MRELPDWLEYLPTDLPAEDFEYLYLIHVLAAVNNNRSDAARVLRLSVRGLRDKLDRARLRGYPVPPPLRSRLLH